MKLTLFVWLILPFSPPYNPPFKRNNHPKGGPLLTN